MLDLLSRKMSGNKWFLELPQTKLDVIFMSKSHLAKSKAGKLMRMLKFDDMLIHGSDGRSGGLLLLWRREVKIVVNDIKPNFIDVLIIDGSDSRSHWFLW